MVEKIERHQDTKSVSKPDLMNDSYINLLTKEGKLDLMNKADNLLEALYLSPHLFDKEVFKILKKREEKLNSWRHNSQFLGAGLFSTIYTMRRLRLGFYFKNFCYLIIGTFTAGFLGGRLGEYTGNKLYYRKILWNLAIAYNITDNEIEDMHLKLNETILRENKEEQIQKSSLDYVKFKF